MKFEGSSSASALLMVRSTAKLCVSNHEVGVVASSFETRLAPLLRMRVGETFA